jgi:hypothetical protein
LPKYCSYTTIATDRFHFEANLFTYLGLIDLNMLAARLKETSSKRVPVLCDVCLLEY